jgi:uroporphyrinogen decarboxylase
MPATLDSRGIFFHTMPMTKRELVHSVLHNQKAERVPVGFWFHFSQNELTDAFKDPSILDINLNGHRAFFRDFQPDFVKIMTDGFFAYPNDAFVHAATISDMRNVKPLGKNHPWIQKQVEFARTITGEFAHEAMMFYNTFSPSTLFKFTRVGKVDNPDGLLADLILSDKDTVLRALDAVAQDMADLASLVIREGGADGIYFSTQDVTDCRITSEHHTHVIAPPDIAVLSAAEKAGGTNILHICGYEGHRNELSHFIPYPAHAINWAVSFEGVTLSLGKKLFGGKPVIGGFDNTEGSILCYGTRKEIEEETELLLREAGTTGVVLGADCTLPRSIDLQRLEWVRQKAAEISARTGF